MKQKKKIALLLCVLFGFFGMCTVVRADAPPASYREHLSESEQAAFDRILEETDAVSQADRIIEHTEPHGTSRVGMNEWFAIYNFCGSFEALADAPAEAFLDTLSADPVLYVPVYHCAEGDRERLIGCVVVSQSGTLDEEIRYRAHAMAYGNQQGYTNMPDRIGTFEKVQKIGAKYGMQSVSHAVAVSVPNPYCGFDNTLLLIQADGIWYVYDFEDSLTLESANSTEKLYTLEEYIDLRAEHAKNQEPSSVGSMVIVAVAAVAFVAVTAVGVVVCLTVLGVRTYKKRKTE